MAGTFVSSSKLWILMEYCSGGSLRQLIERMGPLSEDQALVVAKQIIESLTYLHSQGTDL
jgi:serine/threonine-protein kinase 24/25/MST4